MLYMQRLSESTGSIAAVVEQCMPLSWLHGLAGLQQLGRSPLVKLTLKGLKEPSDNRYVEGHHGGGCWVSSTLVPKPGCWPCVWWRCIAISSDITFNADGRLMAGCSPVRRL